MHLRYVAKPVPRCRHRWRIWDNKAGDWFSRYDYRSQHRCNKAADKLNGISNREGKAYRFAKTGTYHG